MSFHGQGRSWRGVAFASAAALLTTVLVATGAPVSLAATAAVHEYPLPSPAGATDITLGPDGNLWFSDGVSGKVGKLSPSGSITEFPTTSPPTCITSGGDGNVWFVEAGYPGLVGRVTPAGAVAEFPTGGASIPTETHGCITAGPDGNVWFTDSEPNFNPDQVASITPTGTITAFAVNYQPGVITAGPDGNLWFAELGAPGGAIGRITPQGTGYTELTLPPSGNAVANPTVEGITVGPDGNLWFTTTANQVGHVTPDGKTFTQFPIPRSGSEPAGITTGPDGNMWFTETAGDRVARVTPAGAVDEVLLANQRMPEGITSAAGRLWFTETSHIGALDPASLKTTPAPPCLRVTTSIVLGSDIGPCRGDGIVVAGKNLTIDLHGHKVFAAAGKRTGDHAGIHLAHVGGVTVKNGEVTGFDAGVWVEGGSANTLTGLNVHDNLGPANQASNLGDGIVVTRSPGNHITKNTVHHNGPFDGIGVLGAGSSSNSIDHNQVSDSTDEGLGSGGGLGSGIVVSAFSGAENRPASVSHDDVTANTVTASAASGIVLSSDVNAQVVGNTVNGAGYRPTGSAANRPAFGIALTAGAGATPSTTDLVGSNAVTAAYDAAIDASSNANVVTSNHVIGPDILGIESEGHSNVFDHNVATGSSAGDLADQNFPSCDHDTWYANSYTSAFPSCTTNGGHQVPPPPGSPSTPARVQPLSASTAAPARGAPSST